MAIDGPTTLVRWLDGVRQSCPAQHCADFCGDVWARAMRGPTRPCMTHGARTGGVVARPLARGDRVLAEAQGDRRGVRQRLVTPVRQPLGGRL